ncbi:LysR family transcriptional regulator [Faecalispora anaeroviscerum]|uniref:LysR family transcriptional regulator n=1 Tax=Faecalispora anaeroviscerum TaxID=2991836 RepID=UPI0024B8DDB3|nr:LysR family transcriptional regulator [Faecalispora anaeroviscerum]
MDTASLFYFTEAAKDLNFTQTANRLFLSQQNLSNHIARMESILGCKLFQRKPKLELTYEGELFLSYAKEAVASENNMMASIKSIQNENAGELRIGITTPRASIIVPEIMEVFNASHPGIHIKLFDQPSYLLEKMLVDNRLDFCIGVIYSEYPELQSTHLLTDKVYLCVSDRLLRSCYGAQADELREKAKYGANVADFSQLPLVMSTDSIPLTRAILSCYEEVGSQPNVLLTTTYPQFFHSLYYSGIAAAFMTEMILADILRHQQQGAETLYAFPLLRNGDFLCRDITLTVNCHRYLSKPAKHFISLTQNIFSSIAEQRKNENN